MHGQALKWLSYYRQLQSGCVGEAGGRGGGRDVEREREEEGGRGLHILHPYEPPPGSSYSLAKQLASHFILHRICVVVLGPRCVCVVEAGRGEGEEGKGRQRARREGREGRKGKEEKEGRRSEGRLLGRSEGREGREQ